METDAYSLEEAQSEDIVDGKELDERSKSNLRAMIEDSCLAAKLSSVSRCHGNEKVSDRRAKAADPNSGI